MPFIIALILAAAAASTGLSAGSVAQDQNSQKDTLKNIINSNGNATHNPGISGWDVASSILSPGIGTAASIASKINQASLGNLGYGGQDLTDLQNLSSTELDALLDEYKVGEDFNIFNPQSWFSNHGYDYDAFWKDYNDYLSWKDKVGDIPELPNFENIEKEANEAIDAENKEVQSLYDNMFSLNKNMLQDELNNNVNSFIDYRNQLLSNDAMRQQAIAGSTRYEIDRQQRNAITRGASAAQQLVANINAQLGTQAKSAQQALETSNNLASQLLAQRQAAQGIRNSYMNNLNNYTNQRASLISGSAERKSNYANTRFGIEQNKYDNAYDRWNDMLDSHSDNPWSNIARQNSTRARYSNNKL